MKQLSCVISGQVQGVNFCSFARDRARELGLSGFVRNQEEGTIQIVVQGEMDILEKFLEEIKIGPQYAEVKNVETNWSLPTEQLSDFSIR